MTKDIQKIVERANKDLRSNSSRFTIPYCIWLENKLIEAEQELSKLHQPTVISAVCEHTKGSCKIVDKKHTMKCDDCGEIIWQTDL